MQPGDKYCTENFVLEKVMTRSPAFIYLAAIIGFIVAALVYIYVLRFLFYRGGLPFCVGIMLLVMMLVINTQAKTVSIFLDQKSLFINNKRFLKTEIAGIYTYDYDLRDRTRVNIKIILKNGNKLYLTDTNLFERKDEGRSALLSKLLRAMKKRLELELVHTGKWGGRSYYTPKNLLEQ